jgi:hypothetical protein
VIVSCAAAGVGLIVAAVFFVLGIHRGDVRLGGAALAVDAGCMAWLIMMALTVRFAASPDELRRGRRRRGR